MMHTEEATTYGYSSDMEQWVMGYEGREVALLQAIDDVSRSTPPPFDIYTATCRHLPLRYDVTQPDFKAAGGASDPAAFLVEMFIKQNEKADMAGTLFEGVQPDDDLRAAIRAAENCAQASDAMLDWLEHRTWLPGSRAIEIDDVRKHSVATKEEGAA